jgi:hypothetical protein
MSIGRYMATKFCNLEVSLFQYIWAQEYSHMFDYRRGLDWRMDLLTSYTHDLELQAIKAPPLSLFPLCYVFTDCLCGLVVRFPGYRSRGPGFDSRHCQIF